MQSPAWETGAGSISMNWKRSCFVRGARCGGAVRVALGHDDTEGFVGGVA
jgi:hypothetical protein